MTSYDTLSRMAKTRKRKLANNTYLNIREDGGYAVRLHSTDVVIFYQDRIVLDSGGWQTVTTKDRMNGFSPFMVYSDSGVWYVRTGSQDYPFADGITFHNDGTVTGAGSDPNQTKKLRKSVNKYAKAYVEAFFSGQVPEPSTRDCWGCCMIANDGSSPMGGADHIESHIRESYFVPSILLRASDKLSPFAKDCIARVWAGEPAFDFMETITKDQMYKAVRKFCLHELGLAS